MILWRYWKCYQILCQTKISNWASFGGPPNTALSNTLYERRCQVFTYYCVSRTEANKNPYPCCSSSMSSTQSTEKKSSISMRTKLFFLKSETYCLNKEINHQLYFLVMVELFKFLQLLGIEERGRKLPASTSVGGRPGMHRQTCCIKEWILGLCLPKWFQHRGKSKLVTTQETTFVLH